MTHPMVSVVIPAYNAADTLGRAIDSVQAQTYDDWELIVVDDGSTDATSAVAQGRGGRIRLVRTTHLGPGEARNHGVSVSRGRYLAWLDADDVWYPHKLARQVELARSDDALEFITADYRYMDESGWRRGTGFEQNDWLVSQMARADDKGWLVFAHADTPMFLRRGFGATITMMVTRGLFERVGGFCGWLSVAEDVHFAMRAVTTASKFGAVCEPLATYYLHQGSTVRRDDERSQQETIRAYQDLRRVLSTCGRSVRRALAEPLSRAHLDHATVLGRQGRRREGLRAAWRSLRLKPRRMALSTLLDLAAGR